MRALKRIAARAIKWAILQRQISATVAEKALQMCAIDRLLDPACGKAYGISEKEKKALLDRSARAHEGIPHATDWINHVVLMTGILNIPREISGAVIECGCYKGASTASLSIACKLVGRELIVCDSFEGLPEDASATTHNYPHLSVFGYYTKGMYAGRLEEVKANIANFGELSACRFVPGFFSETLPRLSEPLAFAFLDVDLLSSLQDCVKTIWPHLPDNSFVYTDDSCDMETVKLWFDETWWRRELGEPAPGYVGSGCGLPLSPTLSALGYARKVSKPSAVYGRVAWLHYPASKPQG